MIDLGSLWSAFFQWLDRKEKKEKEKLSANSAILEISMPPNNGGHKHLIISNLGNSDAVNVRVTLTYDKMKVIRTDLKLNNPFILSAGTSRTFEILTATAGNSDFVVSVTWEDNYSKQNTKTTSLQFQ